jgi:hypothetical protein
VLAQRKAEADLKGPEHAANFGTVIFDGIDMRAWDLPSTEPREPFMVCVGDDNVCEALELEHEKGAMPIGEGDIKLMSLENRIRQLKLAGHPLFVSFQLALTVTIDTDSLMILMMDAAKRRLAAGTDNIDEIDGQSSMYSVLCMRERAQQSQSTANPTNTTTNNRASYLCCDTVILESEVQKHLWHLSSLHLEPTPNEKCGAMLALCSVAAVCGCDFTGNGMPGSRFDHFWECMPKHLAANAMDMGAYTDLMCSDPVTARSASETLTRVCHTASIHMSGKARFKRQAGLVGLPPEELLLRALWTAAYWALSEHTDVRDWGFTAAANS